MPDRELPHDADAERTVLGAILADNAVFASAAGVISADDLHREQHRRIWRAVSAVLDRGERADLVTVRAELARVVALEAAGGVGYLAGLVDGLPRMANVGDWARLIKAASVRRQLIHAAERIAASAYDPGQDPSETTQAALKAVSDVAAGSAGASVVSLGDVLPESMRRIDEFACADDGVTGIGTGLLDLDRLTGGLKPGQLWIVAARPSRGKSALCLQVSLHAAERGKRGLLFTLEMPPAQIGARALYHSAEVDRWDLKRTDKRDEAHAALARAYGRLHNLPVRLDRRGQLTAAQIRATAMQEAQQRGLDFVVVDYLQRCSLPAGAQRDWAGVGEIATQLKSLARTLDVPVLAACQLNADAEETRPTLANLAQARGIISAEADLIALLHPADPKGWRKESLPKFGLHVDKQRDGETSTVDLYFQRAWTRFVDASSHVEEWSARA